MTNSPGGTWQARHVPPGTQKIEEPAIHPELKDLTQRLPQLAECATDIEAAFNAMRETFAAGGRLLLCGNGGSAADAEHIAGEMMKGFHRKRPLAPADRAKLGDELGSALQGALPAIPLTGFPALASAFANDERPQLVFAQMVWGLGRPGDALLAISTSGKSANVLHAMHVARARDMRVIGLTGRDGGDMPPLCDVCIRVPAAGAERVQEHHLPVYHCLCAMLEDAFFPAS